MMDEEQASRLTSLIRFHLQNDTIDPDDKAELAALADLLDPSLEDDVAVWRFAREFARTAGDSKDCNCTNCRAYRAVRDDEGHL